MVSRAQIDRLIRRVEGLAPRKSAVRSAVILMKEGETEDEAVDRHYREHPDDRSAPHVILVSFVDPGDRKLRASDNTTPRSA
jgi:hypothetical protein